MPKFIKTSTDKIIEKEQKTNTGIYITAGDIDHSDYDTKDWSDLQKDYTHMRDGHALISTTVDILKYPILMSEYRIESKNKEVEDYCYWVLNNLEKGFDYFRRHKLLALDFGLSLHEVIIKRGDKYNGKLTNRPVWFNPIQNETVNRFYYDEQTRFKGIEHEKRIPEKNSEFIDIYNSNNNKIDGKFEWRLEYFSFNEEYNDIRGRAVLRPVRYYWENELKILNATVTGIQRGAGIPIIYTHGEPSTADQTTIEKIGRTISQMRNGYASANKERVEIQLVEPKGQQNILPLLQWHDSRIFFNTMSQFMTSGIGGNGSRAATSEHKSSYELAANYILQIFEVNIQSVIDRIVGMSHFAKIPANEYPKFHFNAINQVDLNKVAQNLKILLDSGALTKQREDEIKWRDMFGQPELKVTTKIADPNEKPFSMFGDRKENLNENKKLNKKERKLSEDLLKFEKDVFSLESAKEHYQSVEKQIDSLINKKYSELIDDIILQLEKNRFKTISIRSAIIEETIDEVMEIYRKGYNIGERDVKTEFKKIGGDLGNSKLQISEKQLGKKREIIARLIKTLFFNTKNNIENEMQAVTDGFIKNKGGISIYLDTWKGGSKQAKNNIKKNVENGYIDGRGETLLDLSDDIETYLYTAVMDVFLCEECAPFDGLILTKEEINSSGISFSSPVNPDCLGRQNCRCTLISYKIKNK